MDLTGRGLRRTLDGRLVLDGVDIDVPAGTVTGMVGANGAGKSTLLRLLAGIDAPDAGRVALDGVELRTLAAGARARRISVVPQVSHPQWPLSGRDVVSLGRLPHGAGFDRLSAADADAIARAMARTGTQAFAGRRIDHLSTGERARLLLARALATEAPVLLVDEPTSALDPGFQLDAMAALRGEAARGVAVAVALHDLSLAARFCSRVVLLANGRVLGAGTPADVLRPDALRVAYGTDFALLPFGAHVLPVPLARPGATSRKAPP
jgi:iron complex transport system ATP-binding protein